MNKFPRGTRVVWGPKESEAIGSVVSDQPDKAGLVTVCWDGIGTYQEDPLYLRPAGDTTE